MGRIARLLEFTRTVISGGSATVNVSVAKVDLSINEVVSPDHYASPGDDSFPIQGDTVYTDDVDGTGKIAAVGYMDTKNTSKALIGEKRIYARDANGDAIGEVYLKNTGEIVTENANGSLTLQADGTIKGVTGTAIFTVNVDGSIKGENGSGSFELQAGGTVSINGLTIDPSGNLTTTGTATAGTVAATTSLTVAGKEMDSHAHGQGDDSAGNTEQNTGGPL